MPLLRLIRPGLAQVRQCPAAGGVLAALILAAVGVLAVPAPAAAQPELNTYESRYYKIHTNLTREEAVDFGVHMDLIFAEYQRLLRSLRGKARGKQDMYLLRNANDYMFALAQFGIDATNSGGMFFYGPQGSGLATFVEGRDRGEVFSTLQHEGFHQFAFIKTRGNLPIWVNEGLAEYFGDAIVVAGNVKHGVINADRLQRVRTAVDNDRAIPFGQMLTIDSPRWRNNMLSGSPWGALQYDQAWSIVHFLIHADPRFERAFSAYLGLLSDGRHPPHAFADAFGSNDPAPFEIRYRAFLDSLEPDPYGAALTRMRFLAAGLEFLHREDQPTPADLDALRTALRDRKYSITHRSHGTVTEYSAADDAMFTFTDDDGAEHPFVIEPAADDADIPPSILAPELAPAARLVWVRYDDGTLQTDLKFGR